MIVSSHPFPLSNPLDVQPPGIRWAELRQDVLNTLVRNAPGEEPRMLDLSAMLTRPAILRRLAATLAERLPPATERLVAPSAAGVTLVAAVALESGLPFCLLTPADGVFGDLFPGEPVVLVTAVTATGSAVSATASALISRGARVLTVLTALDTNLGAAERLGAQGLDYIACIRTEEV
ncbi:hypothetical protein [Nonomuraea sp. NPDC050691]|uniref:hypothetical protein n=1 Tax=Nonomuraea sp. NPDC050691 TaxID=3155661 RepID=UPI0033FBBFC3